MFRNKSFFLDINSFLKVWVVDSKVEMEMLKLFFILYRDEGFLNIEIYFYYN